MSKITPASSQTPDQPRQLGWNCIFPPAALYWFFIGNMFHPHHLFFYKCILSLPVVKGPELQNSDPDPDSARAPLCPE